jgi:two-component system OmpR family response regulator
METTILLVDDHRRLVEHAARSVSVKRPDWRFLVAHSNATARKALDDMSPDAAVLNEILPDGNGLDLMRELKNVRPKLPVIMISSRVSDDLLSEFVTGGGYALLQTPLKAGKLMTNLEQAVAREEFSPSWKNPHALCNRPADRALALYRPFDHLCLLK